MRATPGAPVSASRRASSAVGRVPSARRELSSSRSTYGFPWLAACRTSASPGSGGSGSAASTSAAVACALSGAGRIEWARPPARSASSADGSTAGSPERMATTRRTGRPSSRRSRNSRNRSDGPSAHCTSSTASSSGASPDRWTVSQYSACNAAYCASDALIGAARGSPTTIDSAKAAGPSSSMRRCVASGPATAGSKSWRAMPNANSRSNSLPRAASTRAPAARPRSTTAHSSADLPIPAGPSTSTARPRPRCASAIAASPSSSASSRSSSGAPPIPAGDPPSPAPSTTTSPRPAAVTRWWATIPDGPAGGQVALPAGRRRRDLAARARTRAPTDPSSCRRRVGR